MRIPQPSLTALDFGILHGISVWMLTPLHLDPHLARQYLKPEATGRVIPLGLQRLAKSFSKYVFFLTQEKKSPTA